VNALSSTEAPPQQPPQTKPVKAANPMTLRRQVKRMIVILVILYVAICAGLLACADRILFQPHPSGYADDKDIVKLKTSDGALISAMYMHSPSAKYTILFSHGNAEDIRDVFGDMVSMKNHGFSVLAYDYHGYGTSQGKPSEDNCYRDIDAAYDYLTGTLKVPASRILLLGRSVGSGPAVDLATRKPVGGLILESALTSAFRVFWIGYMIPGDRFRNIDKIAKVTCPVLVVHGRDDQVVPFAHGQQLFAAANEPKQCLWVDGGNHNDLPEIGGKKYDQAMKDFAKLVESGQK
jgi:pimeloyl-ACP methyl ester carboxylesterase